jgi:hypothetical protein
MERIGAISGQGPGKPALQLHESAITQSATAQRPCTPRAPLTRSVAIASASSDNSCRGPFKIRSELSALVSLACPSFLRSRTQGLLLWPPITPKHRTTSLCSGTSPSLCEFHTTPCSILTPYRSATATPSGLLPVCLSCFAFLRIVRTLLFLQSACLPEAVSSSFRKRRCGAFSTTAHFCHPISCQHLPCLDFLASSPSLRSGVASSHMRKR